MMTDDALKAAPALAERIQALKPWASVKMSVEVTSGDLATYQEYYNALIQQAQNVPALLAHVAAQAADLAALRAVAQAVVENGWYRGDYNGGGTCEWCAYGQEPHWMNKPERHAPDCMFVAARNLVQPASDGALPPIVDWIEHG